jgi:hypothetical protein
MNAFAVSRVGLDQDGRVTALLWARVDSRRNEWVASEAEAPVADVVRALHSGAQVLALLPSEHGHVPDRRITVVEYDHGWESIALDGPTTHEREIHDIGRMQP